jgi:hypothetical protein
MNELLLLPEENGFLGLGSEIEFDFHQTYCTIPLKQQASLEELEDILGFNND